MGLYQWLLALHVTGAFLLMGGGVMLAVPILATICVLGYAVAWFARSRKP